MKTSDQSRARPDSAFRSLRHCTGLSQGRFAALVGVSVGLVQATEQRRFAVSANLARSAFLATGCNPASLTDHTEEEKPLAWNGEAYAPKHFWEWSRRLRAGELFAPELGVSVTVTGTI